MRSPKAVIGFVFVAILLGAAAAGGTYVTMMLRQRQVDKDVRLTRGLIDQGEYEQAKALIQARLDNGRGGESWYATFLAFQLDVHRGQGETEAAIKTAKMLLDPERDYEGDPVREAHAYLGEAALESEDTITAKTHYDAILAESGPDGAGADVARLGLVRIQMANVGVAPQIREELESLIHLFPDSDIREDVEYVLGQCNIAMLYSPIPMGDDEIYSIRSGDTLSALGRKNNVSADFLMRVNAIPDARRLSIGKRIKIPKVDFSIEVDKTNNTLTLFNHGHFFKRYRVRTGAVDYMTPVGEYKVQSRKKNPQWTDPKTLKTYRGGHPENELGSRWIGFQEPGLGLHGTIHPETLGAYASNGCVGMLMQDIEELFDLVRVGTPLKITGRIQTEPHS